MGFSFWHQLFMKLLLLLIKEIALVRLTAKAICNLVSLKMKEICKIEIFGKSLRL